MGAGDRQLTARVLDDDEVDALAAEHAELEAEHERADAVRTLKDYDE